MGRQEEEEEEELYCLAYNETMVPDCLDSGELDYADLQIGCWSQASGKGVRYLVPRRRRKREKEKSTLLRGFLQGSRCRIQGLQSHTGVQVNGQIGEVMGDAAQSGRLQLRLYETDPPRGWKLLKPENLREVVERGTKKGVG